MAPNGEHTTNHAPLEYAASIETLPAPVDNVDTLIAALIKSKRELDIARQQFDAVVDPRLIDHVVFRIGAAERHFNYLIQLARQQNLSVEGVRFEWFEET